MAKRKRLGSLYLTTKRIFDASNTDLVEVAHTTGLPYFWLLDFAKGRTKDPSVNRVQALYEHLTGRKLDV